MDDPHLLRLFVRDHSQAAFRDLIARHADWLHSVCLRRLRDPSLAEDATQAIFLALAQNAPKLLHHPTLSPWLHQAAKFITLNLHRARTRRTHHESEAAAMHSETTPPQSSLWQEIEPLLEPALDRLPPRDRQSILLHFYEKKSHAQIAALLHISPPASQKRLSRALDRLRSLLTPRSRQATLAGDTLSTSVVATLLHSHAVTPVPSTLALSLASFSPSTLPAHLTPLAKGVFYMTHTAKLKTAAILVMLAVAVPASWFLTHLGTSPHPPAQSATAPPFNDVTFAALTDRQRLDFFMEKMRHRDKALENLSFKLQQNTVNIIDDGSRKTMRSDNYEVRRLGPSRWMHFISGRWDMIGSVNGDDIFAWDGKTSSHVTPAPPADITFIRVLYGADIPTNFSTLHFNRMIGINYREGQDDESFSGTLSDWIDAKIAAGIPVVVTPEPDHESIKMQMTLPPSHDISIWLSSSRDFMISRQESVLHGANESFSLASGEVLASAKISDIWLPQKILNQLGNGDSTQSKIIQEYVSTATEFKIGTMTPASMKVAYPSGAKVTDSNRLIAYHANPDGTYTLEPFTIIPHRDPREAFDPTSPQPTPDVRMPPANPIVTHIDDSTSTLYTTLLGTAVQR